MYLQVLSPDTRNAVDKDVLYVLDLHEAKAFILLILCKEYKGVARSFTREFAVSRQLQCMLYGGCTVCSLNAGPPVGLVVTQRVQHQYVAPITNGMQHV